MTVLLIHPPAVKAAEPPLGPAILAGYLQRQGIAVKTVDANLGAYLHLLHPEQAARAAGTTVGTTVRRALAQAERSLALLRSESGTASFARYATAVRHLQTLLGLYGAPGERLTLGDYTHANLSPFALDDLARLASGEKSTLFAAYFRNTLLPTLPAVPPKVIALSLNYRHQILPGFELAGMLRRRYPQARIVAGGGMITSWQEPLKALNQPLPPFDHLVFGPGEMALAALACGTELGPLGDGGPELAFSPDFTDLPPQRYFSPRPVLPLATSRGCYWGRCRFCPEAVTPTHPFSAPAPAALTPVLTALAERHGVRDFHLTDNAIPPAMLRALARPGAVPPGCRWHGFVRFEPFLLEAGLLPALAQNGCALLQLGLESGAQPLLDHMAKGTELTVAAEILARLDEAGIASYVYVMFGIPGETEVEAAATRRFLEEHAARIGYLNLAVMNLPRDADLAAPNAPLLPGGELGLYRTFTPAPEWDRGAARRFLAEVATAPLLRPILARTPPYFTSNHAFFFSDR